MDRKLSKNIRDVQVRATQRASLQLQCLAINGWGGVYEYFPILPDEPGASGQGPSAQHRARAPYVPYTQASLPPDVSLLQLKEELNAARSDAKTAATELDRERERCSAAKRRCESAQAEGDAALRLVELANLDKIESSKKLKVLSQHR